MGTENHGRPGFLRCRRCRTYVNPYVAFTDAGRKWRCNICALLNDGVHFTSYHGNFMLRSSDLLALPAVDCDKAFALQFTLDETLLTIQTVTLCECDNEMSKKLTRILHKFRENDPSYYQLCHLVRQGEQPREGHLLLANLVEEIMGGTNGYVDWIIQIHRQVQQSQ